MKKKNKIAEHLSSTALQPVEFLNEDLPKLHIFDFQKQNNQTIMLSSYTVQCESKHNFRY